MDVELLPGSNLQMFAALGDGLPLSVMGAVEVGRTEGSHWPWPLRGHILAA